MACEAGKAGDSSQCPNRTDTAKVCYNDKICQCTVDDKVTYEFPNADDKCREGCRIDPLGSHQTLCDVAMLLTDPAPCHDNCEDKGVKNTDRSRSAKCCSVTATRFCSAQGSD